MDNPYDENAHAEVMRAEEGWIRYTELRALCDELAERLKKLDEAEFQGMFTEGPWTFEHTKMFNKAHEALAKYNKFKEREG